MKVMTRTTRAPIAHCQRAEEVKEGISKGREGRRGQTGGRRPQREGTNEDGEEDSGRKRSHVVEEGKMAEDVRVQTECESWDVGGYGGIRQIHTKARGRFEREGAVCLRTTSPVSTR
jgi:hypothetical protein